MITKFERKVIAGLTAFLMCLSMIFAVPVSVNAEAERTQDEAVSGVQQNETVKDVQIPDGMSENVPHDIIAGDEAGDVPHDITVGVRHQKRYNRIQLRRVVRQRKKKISRQRHMRKKREHLRC